MLEFLSFGSFLLFLAGLLIVYVYRFRSGAPETRANLPSSCQSDTAPEKHGQVEAVGNDSNFRIRHDGEDSFGRRKEGVQALQDGESEQTESLRHRLSSGKVKLGESDEERSKTSAASSREPDSQGICSKTLSNESLEGKTEPSKTREPIAEEVVGAVESKEVGNIVGNIRQTIQNNDKTSGNNDVPEVAKTGEQGQKTATSTEKTIAPEEASGRFEKKGTIQEEHTNYSESVAEIKPLLDDSNAVEKDVHVVVPEERARAEEAISNDITDDFNESFCGVEESHAIKDQASSSRELADMSSNADAEIDSCVSPGPPNIEGASSSATGTNDKQETLNISVDSDDQISDLHTNETCNLAINNILEKFSDRLSRTIVDTVLQDTQLFYSQPEDEPVETWSKGSIMKFSNALANSIVKSVLDYSKISQEHVGDEEHNLSPDVASVSDKQNENRDLNVYCAESVPHEDHYGADEINGDNLTETLHDYAQSLAEQILSNAICSHSQNGVSSERTLTKVYASKLTENVLSDALNGIKSLILDKHSMQEADMNLEDSALDLFITEIVDNALQSAVLKVAFKTCEENEREVYHAHLDKEENMVDPHNECPMENVDINEQSGTLGCNGVIDDQSVDLNELKEQTCSNEISFQQNGKLASKWLSEDDLVNLNEEDASDSENVVAESLKPVQTCANNKGKESGLSVNTLTASSGLSDKEFWRRSLIEDLDDDLAFEEEEDMPHSSVPSSPTKSTNVEDFMVDGSIDSDDDVAETSEQVKVLSSPPALNSMVDSSRSRLRSVDSSPVLVLDNGSAFLKVGFCGETAPKEIVSSVVGLPLRYSQDISGMEYSARSGLVFGGDAVSRAGVLRIEYPLNSDLIEKWSDVEGLWNYVLGSLLCIQDEPDFPVLISQPALNPKKNTEKIAELMFEHFHMPSMYIADQLALTLFSMGYTSGLSFSSGFKSTQAGVVYEGHVLPHSVRQLDIAGYQLTEHLKKQLTSLHGFGSRSSSQWQIVDEIKKKLAFVSLDFEEDLKRYKTRADLQTAYELPDGQLIEIGLERFACAETLFGPSELGLTQLPAHELIIQAINSCDRELQDLCYKAMGVSGGTSLMNGFTARLEQELRNYDRRFKNFTAPENRDLSTWLGGSVFASLPTFQEMVVTVDEYADGGARVIHSKCF